MLRTLASINRHALTVGASAAGIMAIGAGLVSATGLPWEAVSASLAALALARDAGRVQAVPVLSVQPKAPAAGLPQTFIIDHDGTPLSPQDIAARLGYDQPDPSVIAYWVRNGGAVEVQGRRVRCRAETVAPAALLATVEHLFRLPVGPVDLEVYVDGWLSEPHPSPRSAILRLVEAVCAARQAGSGQRFACTACPVDRIDQRQATALAIWQATGGAMTSGLV